MPKHAKAVALRWKELVALSVFLSFFPGLQILYEELQTTEDALRSDEYIEELANVQLDIVWGWSRGKVQSGKDGFKERCSQVGGPEDSSLNRQQMSNDIHGAVEKGDFFLNWNLNKETFQGRAKWQGLDTRSLTWCAVGFSRRHGMLDTDVIMLRRNGTSSFVEDRYSKDYRLPTLDALQSVTLLNYTWTADHIEFSFSRKRDTHDQDDIAFYPKPIGMSWAIGSSLRGHVRKDDFLVDLFRGGTQQNAAVEEKVVEGVNSYLDLQVTAVRRARHLLAWNASKEPDFRSGWNEEKHHDWAQQLEGELSQHPLAQIFLKVCNALGHEDPYLDFSFTLCRASYGGCYFGHRVAAVEEVVLMIAFVIALYFSLSMGFLEVLLMSPLVWFLEDFQSGLVHIVLDNPATLRWPAIHASAAGFQSHHDYPTDSLNFPYNKAFAAVVLNAAVAGYALAFMMLYVLTPKTPEIGTRTSVHIASLLLVVKLTVLPCMMHFHMWAHKDPTEVPLLVQWAIYFRLALSEPIHIGHHLSYKEDFAIINGWSHRLLNFFLRSWKDQNSEDWTAVLFLFQLLPALVMILPALVMILPTRSKRKIN